MESTEQAENVCLVWRATVISLTYLILLTMESLNDFVKQKGFHCAYYNYIRSLTIKHDVQMQTLENCKGNLHVLGLFIENELELVQEPRA